MLVTFANSLDPDQAMTIFPACYGLKLKECLGEKNEKKICMKTKRTCPVKA